MVGVFSNRFPDSVETVGPELEAGDVAVAHGSFETDIVGGGAFLFRFELDGARFVTPWMTPRRGST